MVGGVGEGEIRKLAGDPNISGYTLAQSCESKDIKFKVERNLFAATFATLCNFFGNF